MQNTFRSRRKIISLSQQLTGQLIEGFYRDPFLFSVTDCIPYDLLYFLRLCVVSSSGHQYDYDRHKISCRFVVFTLFRFGDGYSLTITLENLTEKAAIEEAVKREFPTATFKPLPSSHHLFWNIKKSDADKWSVLFRKAHVLSSSFSSISDYSLAQTTLLDAFMRLVKYEDVPKDCD
ncbi:hypothetical protein AB6A40_002513 [Gnathostoma spinigerum]|uniref:Uncharacterized protein n=1 Tax=Gnathostoma spinigerum TaxID=75299 RepID=A0ABD6ECD2_9BILA